MAWLAAVALAVGGLTLQQGAAAPRAEAVTYKGGWDGVFGPDRLWSSNTPVSTLSERGYSHFAGGWVEPWNGLSERTRYQWMDTNGTINGAGVALYATMGIGPLFKSEGDVGLALVSISPDRRLAVIGPRTAGGQLNGVQWSNELTGSDPAGHSCQMSNLYGAEVNKKNGHLYVTGSDQYKRWVWQGDNSAGEVGFASAIFQLKSDQTVTCLATSQGKTAKPKSGKSINQQWQEEFGTSVSGNWTIASDLSIDAYGNFYLWGRNDNNKHALLSLQPPRKSNGDYDAGGQWQYEVLKFFNANVKDDNTGYGMAVMNAKVYIYTSDRYMQEWDIPSGAMGEKGLVWGTDISDRTDRDMDLASTQIATLQMGAVLQGTVYDDADADGSVSGDAGMPGVEVEIWRQAGSGAPTLHDSVLTEADGSYVAFLPSGADNLYLRVKQPQVDGVNAVQTYASAGSFTGPGAGANTVTPLCRNAGADYAPRSSSGWCGGARADMIDPSDVTNPLAGQLGAAFVTKVSVGSDTADTVADFAFTTAGSYGDAGPAGSWGVDYRTRSTKADAGAFHNSSSVTQVKLGTTNDVYTDGVNHATSNEHPSDDGVFVRFHNGSLGLMQDQLLSAGRSYTLEARVSAGLGGVQNVKVAAWASANNATNAMIGSTAAAVGFGQPDAQGRALAVWGVPASPSPSGGMSASTLRVSASTQSGITAPDNTTRQYAPQPGTWQANSRAWVSDGEVEDYRYHVTTGQVRVALVSSSVPVNNVGYTVSNAVTTSPSTNSGTLRATTAGEAWTSPAKHSVTNSGAATTVSLTSVPSGQTVVGGSCVDSTSGADPWGPGGLNAANKPVVSGQSITIPANTFTGSWTDLMCTFSLGKAASTSTSEFTLNPASGTAQAGSFVTGTVTVRDSSNFVMPGVTVRLASDHAAVTLKDANGQAITSCATNSQGQCQVRVSSDVAGTYANAVHATIQTTAGGSWVEVGPSNDATRRSPKTVTFTAGPPSSAQSGLSVDPASLPVGGTAQVTVTLRDQHGNAVSGKAAALNVSATAGATLSTAWTESPANSGVYVGTVTSSTPGTYTVQAAPTGATVSDTVRFLASTTASAGKSTLVVSPTGSIKAGEDYTLVATLYDGVGSANSGRGNPVPGVAVSFSVDPGQDFGSEGFSAPTCTSGSTGACHVTFSSSKPGAFTLHAKVADRDQANNPLTDVGSSPQNRVVLVADVSADNSTLTVTPNVIVGEAAVVTLTLKDAFDNPVTGLTNAQLVMSVAPSGAVLSALAETVAGSGVYTGTVTSSTARAYTVSAHPSPLSRPLMATTDFTWRTLPADGTSTLTVAPNPARAGSSLTVTLVVKDANDQAVTGLADVLTLTSTGMTAIPAKPTESPTGTYTWHVGSVQAAGPYQALVKDAGSGVVTADYVLTQVASGVNSSIAISDNGLGKQANDTDFYTVTVTLRDLTDVPIADGLDNAPDGKPKLSLVGPNNADHTIWDLAHAGAGVYTAKVRASAAASYTVSASYDRGANTVSIGSVTARFSSPTPAAAHSSFTVSTGDRVVGTGQHTVTATFRNDQGQPVAVGAAQLSGSKAYPSATVGAFAQIPNQPGVYQAPITATVAGLKTVEVAWTDGASTVAVQPAVAGDDKVMFVAGPAVAPSATFGVTTGNRLTNGTAFHEAWVVFADQYGNPRPGDSATFTLLDDAETGVATTGARFGDAGSGSFEVTVQADAAGRAAIRIYSRVPTPVGKTGFPVRATVGANQSGVKHVPFSPETANPAHSSFTVTPASGTKVADGQESFAGEVALKDANNLPVPGATASMAVCRVVDAANCAPTTDVAVTAPDGGPANLVASRPDGMINVKFTAVKAGTYQVTAKIGEDPIGAAAPHAKTIQFVAGQADATRSSLVWSAAPVVANGSDTNQVQALVKDAHDNIVADGTKVKFQIPAGVKAGSTQGAASVEASTVNGLATILLTSVKADTYTVTATVSGSDVEGNAPALVRFGNGPVSASESVLSITTAGPKVADGTQFHTAQVELKDAQGNPAVDTATVVQFCWDVDGQTAPCQDATSAVAGGKATAAYDITSSRAGTLTVTAKVKATGDPVSPATGVTALFVAGTPDAAESTLTTSQGRVTNNGTAAHWAEALITDANGNPTGNVEVTFTVTGSARFAGGQSTTATRTTDTKGQARVEVTDVVAEQTTITATITQGEVGTGTLLFAPGDVDPGSSSFTVTPATAVPVSDGRDANHFTARVTLRDSADAAVAGEAVTLEFSGPGPKLVGGGTTCTTDVNGTCEAGVYSSQADTWQVKATINGGATQIGSDKSIAFTAGGFDANHSTLAAQSGAATADGLQTRWVEAQLRDRFDNPTPGVTVIFTFPSATTLAAGTPVVVTDTNGKSRIELRSAAAGAHTVSAQAVHSGAPVALQPDVQVTFKAGAASAANSSLTIPTAAGGQTKVADGAQTHRAEVQVRDAQNNPVDTGTPVTFTMTPPGGAPAVVAATTNAQGVAVAEWTAVKAGDHTVNATVNAQPVGSGDGSTARFVPGPVDPTRSTFQVTGDLVLNNGVNQHAATVVARDAHDNVIGSVPVQLTISEGEASIPGPVLNAAIAGGSASKSLTTDSSGSASSVIVSEEEGTFTVEAKIGSPAVSLGTKTVDFAPGSPSVANSTWTIAPATGTVEVSEGAPAESYVLTITVRSGNNLLVGGAAVKLSGLGVALPSDLVVDEAPAGAGYWTTGDKTSGHYGQAVLHVRSKVAGEFPITAQILPDAWPSLTMPASYTLKFKEGAPDQARSTFTITPGSNTVDDHATATFTIKDAHGNGVPGLDPVIDFIPPLTTPPQKNTANWGAGGVYTWDVTTSAAAAYTGTATLDVPAPGTDVVKTAQVVFQPGQPQDECTPAGSTTAQVGTRIEIDNANPVPVDDGFHVATVTVVDGRCNPVPSVDVQWTTDPKLTQVAQDTTTTTNASGQAVVKVTSTTAGAFDVTAAWGPGTGTAVVNGSPAVARFAAGSCQAAASSFTVDKTSAEVGDDPGDGVVFTISLRDANGNACSSTAPTVQVAPAPGDTDGVTHAVVGPPQAAGQGVYTVQVQDKSAETVDVTVSSGSTLIQLVDAPATANPQPITFTAETTPSNPPCVNPSGQQFDGSHITVDSADAVTADGIESHEVTAVVVDRFCNPIPNRPVVWDTAPELSLDKTTTPTDAAGVAQVRVTSTVAGSHEVSGQMPLDGGGDLVLGGSPQLATFKAGACQAGPGGTSSFDVNKLSAVAGSSDGIQVTMTLLDAQGNACVPASDAKLTVTAENNTTAVVTNPSGSQGKYTSTVTDTVAETVDLRVSLGADDVAVSQAPGHVATTNPQPVTFTAGAVSETKSTWAVAPERDVPGSVFTGTLSVKDGLNNPVPGLSAAEIDLDAGGMQILTGPVETVKDVSGVYEYTATQTAAATYTLQVTLNNGTKTDTSDDVTLSDTATVTAGSIDPTTHSHVTVSPTSTGVGQQATVTVHVADGWDNPISNLTSGSFTVKGQEGSLADPATDIVADSFVNQGSGNYTFQITSQKATTYEIHATVAGVGLTEHPTVEFTTGGVCVSNCTPVDPTHVTRVEMTLNDQLADGQAQDKATAFAYDVFGNPRAGAQVKAQAVNSPSLDPQLATCTTETDGTCELAWASKAAGTFGATVTIDDLQFATSQLGSIRFTNGAADPGSSTLTVSPASPILVGASYTLQAAILDAVGNPVPNEPVAFAVDGANAAAATVGASCTTNSLGVCTVEATSKTADAYTVTAHITTPNGPAQLTGSPAALEFSARDVCVNNCTPVDPTRVTRVEVTRNGSPVDGENEATVFAYDVYGNAVANVAVTATPGDAGVHPNPSNGSATGQDGTLILGFTSAVAGAHPGNTVTVGGYALTAAQGSPFTLTWATGPVDAAKSTLTVTPDGPITVESLYTLSTRVADGNDNPVSGAAVTFLAQAGPAFVDGVSTCSTESDGTCSVELGSTLAGTFAVQAQVSGADVTGSPKDVVFTAGAICVEAAGCTPDPGAPVTRAEVIVNGVQPDDTERDIVLVSAYDKHGNPVSGALVASAKVDGADDLTVQPDVAATDANGQTTIWYTSGTPGAHLANVTVGGLVPLGSPVSLGFGAGNGDPATSSFTVTPAGPLTVGPTAAYTVTTTVRDVFDDPAPGVVVTVTLDHAGPTWGPEGNTCTSGADGTCSVVATSTVAGTYGIQARLAAGTIGTPESRVWKADAVCGVGCTPQPGVDPIHTTRAELTVDHQTADGDQEDVVTVFGFDQWGNPVEGAAVVPSTTDSDLVLKTGLAGLDAAGQAELRFSSMVAGTHVVTIQVDGATPAGSPVAMHFDPGAASVGNSTVSVDPTTTGVGNDVTVTVHVADAKDNPVPGLAGPRFSVKGYEGTTSDPATDIVAGSFVDQNNGNYTFRLTSVKAQQYGIHATLDGQMIDQHPTVTFTHGGVCVSNCTPTDPTRVTRVEMTVNNQLADGTAEDKAKFYGYDVFGNPVVGAVAEARAVNSAPLTPQLATCTTAADGTCDLAWTSFTAGTFGATVTVGTLEFATSQLSNIVFTNGTADPDESSLAITPASPISVGSSYALTATVKDAHGNPVPGETITFGLEGGNAGNAQLSDATCQTKADGTCQVTLTSKLAGDYTVTAKVTTPGGAADVQGSPAVVGFEPLGPCLTDCTPVDPTHATRVEVTLDGATVGDNDEATVYVYDVYGNPVSGAAVQATPAADVVADPANGSVTDADGQLVLGFTSTVSGPHPGNAVTVAGGTPAGSPFSLTWVFGAIDTTLSTMSKTPAGPIVVDQVYEVSAHVTDGSGNPVDGASVVFGLPAGPRFVDASTCVTGAAGLCSVQVTSTLAGSFAVTGTIGGAALTGSPLTLEFVADAVCVGPDCKPDPGAPRTRVEVIQNGMEPDGVERDIAQVFAYDKHGNPVPGAPVTSTKVSPADDLTVQPVIAPTGADGVSTIWYTSTTAGNHLAAVTVAGQEPTGSPVTLGFGAGNGDPATSSFTVTPAGPLTVGQTADSVYTVTTTVRDVFDTPVSGAVVTVNLDHPGPVFAGGDNTCTTNGQGVCSVEMSSTVAGTYGIQPRIAAGPIGTPESRVWRADAVCGEGCTPEPGVTPEFFTRVEVTTDNQVADGDSADVVTAFGFDKWGNPVEGAAVVPSTADPTLVVKTPLAGIGADGRAELRFTSKVAGAHTAIAMVGGAVPEGSPMTLNFVPGAGCAATDPNCPDPSVPNDRRTRLEVTVDGQTADGVAADQVTAYVFDKFGNPVATAIRSTAPNEVTVQSPIPATSGATGATTIDYTSKTAGTFDVTVEFQRQGVWEAVGFNPQPGMAPPAGQASSPVAITFTAGVVCVPSATEPCSNDPATQTRVELTVDHQTADGDQEDVVTAFGFDKWGNPVQGAAVVPSTTDSDLKIKTAQASLDSNGQAELKFSSTVAGTHVATIQIGGQNPAGSPISMHFDPGAASVGNSTVSVDPTTTAVGNDVTVTVHVADANDNPVPGLTGPRFSVKGHEGTASDPATDITAGSFVDQNNGNYTFRLTSVKAQRYGIYATLDGQMIDQHPFVTFTAGGVCVSNCTPTDPTRVTRVEMTVNNQLADGTAQDKAKFYGYDVFGNPVVGAVAEARAVNSAPLTPQLATCTTGSDGTCELAWTSSTAGTFGATVTVGTLEFATSQLSNIVFTNGKVDPNESSLAITPASPISVGSSYTLTATVKDAHGNPVPDETITFALEGGNAGNAQLFDATCQTKAAGTCQVTLTSKLADTYTVTAKATTPDGAKDVQGSPAQVGFEAQGPCLTNCTPVDPTHTTRVEVTLDGATVGDNDEATVYVYDVYGNPVSGADVQATPASDVVADPANGTATDADGQLVLGFTSTVSGPHPGNAVTVAGGTPAGSPFSLTWVFGAIDLTLSTMSKTPAGPIVVDEVYVVSAHVTDGSGNPVDGASVVFGLPAGPRFVDASTCVTGAAGLCSVQVTSTLAGSFPVTGTIGGAALTGSPLTLEFVADAVCVGPDCKPDPGAPRTRVEVIQNGMEPDGVERDIAQVLAYDKHGNPVPGAPVTSAKVSANDDLTVQPVIAPTGADGTSTIWYTSTTAGNHLATVTVAGQEPTGSPVTLGFGAGNGDPATSSFTVTPAGPLTVGQTADSVYTVTTTVRDVFDTPVQGAVVSVNLDHAGPVFAGGDNICTTNDQGVCSVEMSSTVAGTYGIQPRIAAGPIGTPVSRVWRADAVCGEGCTPEPGVTPEFFTRVEVTTDNQVADGDSADVVTAFGFDKWGNPVEGAAVVPSTADPTLIVKTPLAGIGADGRAELRFTSKVAGAHTAIAMVGGAVPEGSPMTLNFVPGAGCAATDPDCPDPSVPNELRTRLEVTVDGQTADGVAKDKVTAYVFDKFGNPVATAIRSSGPSEVTVQSPIPATSGATGATTIDYTSRTAGTFDVTVEFQRQGVWEAVGFKPQAGTTPPANNTSSPAKITFTAGAVCVPSATEPCSSDPATQTRVQVTKNHQRADGVARDEATVSVFDALGNPVPGQTVRAAGRGVGAADLTVGTVPATGADGTTVVPFTSLKFGWYTAQVTVVVAGQEVEIKNLDADKSSPVALHFVRVDEVPAPVITHPADGDVVNDSTPAFQGTGEPGAVVTITDGGDVIGTTVVEPDGTWTHTPTTPLTDGDHSLTATQEDKDGNTSDPSPAVDVTIDTVPPTAPVVTKPADGANINDNTPTVEGKAEPGSTVTVDAGGGNACTAVAATDGKFSCALPTPLPEGPATITVTATDPAGNVSAPTVVTPKVDTESPDQPVVTRPGDGEAINDNTPTVEGTAEPGSTVTVDAGGGNTCTAVAGADGAFSCTLPTPLPEGPATIIVTATDPAGNVSDPTVITPKVDTESSDRPVVTKPAPGENLNDNTPTVEGTAEPGSTVTVDAGNGNVCTALVAADGSFSCTLPNPLPDGPATITVTATDPARNVSEPTVVEVAVDTVKPAAPVVDSPRDGEAINDNTPTVQGKAEPGSTVTVDAGNGNTCTAKAGADGSFSCTLPKPLPDGPATITVTATDPAGNVSGETVVDVTVDTKNPSPPTVDTSNPTDVTGTADPGDAVTITDGDGDELCSTTAGADGTFSCKPSSPLHPGDEITVTATDPAGNDTSVTVRVVALLLTADPVHRLEEQTANGRYFQPGELVTAVMRSDPIQIGSRAAAADGSVSFTWIIPETTDLGPHSVTLTGAASGPVRATFTVIETRDMTPPAPPTVTSPKPGDNLSTNQPVVAGKDGEPGATVTVVDQGTGSTLCTTVVAADGTWSCTVSQPLADGTHDLSVTETDPAGNVSQPTVVPGVVIDTAAPNPPVVTSPVDGGQWNPVKNPTVEGTAEPGSTVTVEDGQGDRLCLAAADADGEFSCAIPPDKAATLPDGDVELVVTATDPAGNVSDETVVTITVDTKNPSTPSIDTSDPDEVTGTSDPDTTVTVEDGDGQELCSSTADADGKWSCQPSAPLRPGDEVTVTATDPAGNEASVTVRVPEVTVSKTALAPGESQTATGRYFQPGETVSVVVKPGSSVSATATADASGNVSLTWTIPADTAPGTYQVVLTGSLSGPCKVSFQVTKPMPATGAQATWTVLRAAAVAALFGAILIGLAWRRRRDEDIEAARRKA